MLNNQGRPTTPNPGAVAQPETFSGHRGLDLEEGLIFEIGTIETSGVDIDVSEMAAPAFGGLDRHDVIGLPGLSEPEAMRHYTRLSRKNYAIDMGIYPLGSCTMKHNPRLNEKLARLPGFADLHPLQPMSTVQGALELMETLSHWLCELTGMADVALSPKAGAHGELLGMMAIRAALEARGDARKIVLVPDAAHGTNPATAAFCGYRVKSIAGTADGRVDLAALKAALNDYGQDVAAIMLTNPNTCGLFERDMIEIADAVHAAGGFFYCDGANFNAIMGKARPGDLGVDAMHINLHKTFSTPHGGGGPGSGPVVLSEALAPFAPLPLVVQDEAGYGLRESPKRDGDTHLGRIVAFHGQMGMFVRALTFMLSHGRDGIAQAAEDAVLNANYVMARLADELTPSFDGPCMHEALFDDRFLKGTGVTTLDFAKAMIDEGFHPMTMYFPLVVDGAMLIEPTESESKQSLDQFIDTVLALAQEAKTGRKERFDGAPMLSPRARLDETRAARQPVLRWSAEIHTKEAAE